MRGSNEQIKWYQDANTKQGETIIKLKAQIKAREGSMRVREKVAELWEVRCRELQKENRQLRKVLEKYADAENWEENEDNFLHLDDVWVGNSSHGNAVAKEVLALFPQPKEPSNG